MEKKTHIENLFQQGHGNRAYLLGQLGLIDKALDWKWVQIPALLESFCQLRPISLCPCNFFLQRADNAVCPLGTVQSKDEVSVTSWYGTALTPTRAGTWDLGVAVVPDWLSCLLLCPS